MLRVFAFCCLLCTCFAVYSAPASSAITSLYQTWLNVQIEQVTETQVEQYQQLISEADELTLQFPDIAESWALSGMIKSHYAERARGLPGLNSAKQARKELQHALSVDPYVFYGAAYAELGFLYQKTPGWPISFGSDKMARKLYDKALEINPNGLITNIRLGEFFFDLHDYTLAKQYLLAATQAISMGGNKLWLDYQIQKAKHLMRKIEQSNRYLAAH
jgi:tetratricopeptide (TPR) repeat protein